MSFQNMESPTPISLGTFRLTHPKAHLHIKGSANISASYADTYSSHTSQAPLDLELLISGSVWVCRGAGLRLRIRILVDSEPLDDEILDDLANEIGGAEFWRQLRLRATPATVRREGNACEVSEDLFGSEIPAATVEDRIPSEGIVDIEINHVRDLEEGVKSRHKLSVGVPAADVKPPVGVACVGLDLVRLELRVEKQKRRGVKRRRMGTDEEEFRSLEEMRMYVEFEEFRNLKEQGKNLEQEELLNLKELDDRTQALSMPLDPRRGDGIPLTTHATPIYSRTIDDLQWSLQRDEAMDLINASLRMIICDRPVRLAQGIKILDDNISSSLSKIAPMLFSPAYLQGVSQRAVLIPTISHAISNYLQKSTSLVMAQLGLEENRSTPQTGCIRTKREEPVVTAAGIYESNSANLWRLLQANIYDPTAGRRLKMFDAKHVKLCNGEQPGKSRETPAYRQDEDIWEYKDFGSKTIPRAVNYEDTLFDDALEKLPHMLFEDEHHDFNEDEGSVASGYDMLDYMNVSTAPKNSMLDCTQGDYQSEVVVDQIVVGATTYEADSEMLDSEWADNWGISAVVS
ncbi:hypothetical protein M501DRAFT_1014810 [Patellaria atrata CBS 101060]|uniref:Uncharacterized protein n=1 Tax=Patellaria atrata CBS 101060 TaxID=1346257 RepID=A0A9P4SED1_9PEZI|nr:hypothetical protein M501DRAFT_1014810 [Patellaria atrata CBS 101060]